MRGRSNPLDRVLSVKRFGMEVRLNKFSDEQFLQPRICAEASQILLIAEQNLKFCSRPQRKALRHRGKDEKEQIVFTGCAHSMLTTERKIP